MGSISVPATLNRESISRLQEGIKNSKEAVIVLRGGEPGVFCRGLDFEEVTASPEQARKGAAHFAETLSLIRSLDKVVVAVVEGEALGGGIGICAASDLVIATDDSTFGLSEVLFGLIPAVVFPFLSEKMPVQKAKLLALRGYAIPGAQAFAEGLVDLLVDPSELDFLLSREVKNFSRAQPHAIATLKKFSQKMRAQSFEDSVGESVEIISGLLSQKEVLDRISNFVNDGTPPWSRSETR